MMKKLLFYSIALLFIATSSRAQESKVDKMGQAMTDSLYYLNLTDEQKSIALALNKTAATSLLEIGKKAKTDPNFKGKPLLQQVMAVMKKRNEELTKTFNADQQKAFAEHGVQRLADLQTKMMTSQLDLTDAQIPQVYEVNLKSAAEMVKGVEDLKDSKRRPQKARAAKALKAEAAKKDEALKKVLTPEQYQEYLTNKEAMQAAMKEKMQG